MDDLISRQAAIKAIKGDKTMKLISIYDAIRAVDRHTLEDGTLDNDISCILEEVTPVMIPQKASSSCSHEKDTISRQAAIDALEMAIDVDDFRTATGLIHEATVNKVLDCIPAADVVPVRLGEWLDGYKMQTCSLCKCIGKKSWTFCPHCGARMIYGKREE